MKNLGWENIGTTLLVILMLKIRKFFWEKSDENFKKSKTLLNHTAPCTKISEKQNKKPQILFICKNFDKVNLQLYTSYFSIIFSS